MSTLQATPSAMLSLPAIAALASAAACVREALVCTLLVKFTLLAVFAGPAILTVARRTHVWMHMKPALAIACTLFDSSIRTFDHRAFRLAVGSCPTCIAPAGHIGQPLSRRQHHILAIPPARGSCTCFAGCHSASLTHFSEFAQNCMLLVLLHRPCIVTRAIAASWCRRCGRSFDVIILMRSWSCDLLLCSFLQWLLLLGLGRLAVVHPPNILC